MEIKLLIKIKLGYLRAFVAYISPRTKNYDPLDDIDPWIEVFMRLVSVDLNDFDDLGLADHLQRVIAFLDGVISISGIIGGENIDDILFLKSNIVDLLKLIDK